MKKAKVTARKLFCAALTLVMLLGLLPAAALAEDAGPDQIDLYTRWPAAGERLTQGVDQVEAYNITAPEDIGIQLDNAIWWNGGYTRSQFVQENTVYILKAKLTAPGWDKGKLLQTPFYVHFSNHDSIRLEPSKKIWDPRLSEEWYLTAGPDGSYEFILALEVLPIPEGSDICRITFDSNGGSGAMEMEYAEQGSEYQLPHPSLTAPEGYRFDRWDAGEAHEVITVSGDMTLRAQWKSMEHVHDFSGPWHSDENMHYKLCSCGARSMVGHHEYEWVVDREPTEQQPGLRHPVCGVCGYAGPTEEFRGNTFVLSYSGPWGSENLPENAVAVSAEDHVLLTVSAPPLTNYQAMRFLGWAERPDGPLAYEPGDQIRLDAARPQITLYGRWVELPVFTVTYKTGFGSSRMEPTVVVHDGSTTYADIRLPDEAPTHKNKVFAGWTTSRNGSVEYECGDTIRMGDGQREIELIAVWEKLPKLVSYKLDYQTGRGSKAPKDTVVKSRDGFAVLTVTDQIPVKKGFVFAGWAAEKNGSPEIQPGDEIRLREDARRLRLYAVWEPFILE